MRFLIIGGDSVFALPLTNIILADDKNSNIVVATANSKNDSFNSLVKQVKLNVLDPVEFGHIVTSIKPDVIFHLESQNSVGYSWNHPIETVEKNVIGTTNLLEIVHRNNLPSRIVIGGSGEEYGRLGFDDMPISERVQVRPENIFGATKACQTMFAQLYSKAYHMDIIVLRTFSEVSYIQDDRYAISNICHQFVMIEKGLVDPVVYVGNADNIRDFTDAEDLAFAFFAVAQKGKKGEIYNAANGSGVSLRTIISVLEEMTGISVRIVSKKERIRLSDPPILVADTSKIFHDTGWNSTTELERTVEKIYLYWKSKIS